jgi:hypothetical protein
MSSADGDPSATRVDRTGIALVHEGEYIGPDPASAATLGGADTDGLAELAQVTRTIDDAGDVHFWFPVEIEVVGRTEQPVDDVVTRVFDELLAELGRRP